VSDGPLGGRQCTARSKRTGQRCKRAPIIGGTTCWVHGGAAGQVQRKAAVRVAEARAMATFEHDSPNGRDPEPLDVLAELAVLVREVTAFKDFTADRLRALTADDWRAADAGVAAEVALFERAADRAGRLLVDVSRLGIEDLERRASSNRALLEGARAERIVTGIEHTLTLLGLDEEQWNRARGALASMLLWLAGEGAGDR
jgi:hypothetical protein